MRTASVLEVIDSEIAGFDVGSVVGPGAVVGDTVDCCSMCVVVVAVINSDVGKLGLLTTKLLVPGAEISVVGEGTNNELAGIEETRIALPLTEPEMVSETICETLSVGVGIEVVAEICVPPQGDVLSGDAIDV